MKFIIKILLSSISIFCADWLLSGIYVSDFLTSLWLAVVLAFLNAVVKPLLILLTIPITVFTLGLFLLVINVIIIYTADYLVTGFEVHSFMWALLFSFLISIFNSLLSVFSKDNEPKEKNVDRKKTIKIE